jgi:hypothetical protein
MSDPELAAALTEMGPRVLSDLLARSDLQQLRAAATEAMQLEDGSYWDARPQIRTLALATHPRLGASSLLQLLPLGLLQQIARLLKRQRVDPRWASPSEWPLRANPYRPGTERHSAWETDSDKFRWPADALSNDGRSVHISDLPDAATIESPMLLLAGGGLFTKCGVCYVELEISESWCGSQIQIGSNTIECGTKDGMDGYDDNDYFVSVNGGMIDEWEGVWRNEEGKDRLKVGILVDFDVGVCALRLNNANGPCVPLKAEEAREGVMVKLTGDWPDGLTRWSASLSVPEKVPPGLCNYPQRYENLKQQPLQKRQQQQEPTMTHTSGGADSQGREQKKHKIEPA